MKFKLDENIPVELVPILRDLGYEADTARDEGLGGVPDARVWRFVEREGRILITQDQHFCDIREFIPGTHPGIVFVRFKRPLRNSVIERLTEVLTSEDLSKWDGALVVVSERKVRVRAPIKS